MHERVAHAAGCRVVCREAAVAHAAGGYVVCGEATVALLPCNASEPLQRWSFDDGVDTVSSLTSAALGLALAVRNGTLRATVHAPNGHTDAFATPDVSYGLPPLALVAPYAQPACAARDCQDYDPTQKWYWSRTDGKLRHALFTASISLMLVLVLPVSSSALSRAQSARCVALPLMVLTTQRTPGGSLRGSHIIDCHCIWASSSTVPAAGPSASRSVHMRAGSARR